MFFWTSCMTCCLFLYLVCGPLEWGENCQNKCNCAEGVKCDSKNGHCPDGRCKPPFTGNSCQVFIFQAASGVFLVTLKQFICTG